MHFSKAFMLDGRNTTGHIHANSKTEKDELELSSAFASLAVLQHEILAVVVKDDNRNKPVQAIVTSAPQPNRVSGVFTQNPRVDDREASAVTEPMLSTPDAPSQFKEFEEERKKRGDFDDVNIFNQYIDEVLHSQGYILLVSVILLHSYIFTPSQMSIHLAGQPYMDASEDP